MVNVESRWVIILHKLDVFVIIIEAGVKFTSFPGFQLSLHLKSIQTQKHCSFVTKRLWCNIILQAPWMERVVLTAFICKSLWGSVLLSLQELKTSVLHTLVCGWETSNMHKWEKEKTLLTTSPSHLRFDQEQTAASLQSLANAVVQHVENHTHTHTHADTQHAQSIRKLSMRRINMHCFLIKLGTSTGECVCQMYEKIISLWNTGF